MLFACKEATCACDGTGIMLSAAIKAATLAHEFAVAQIPVL